MQQILEIKDLIKQKAVEFGAKQVNDSVKDYIFRDNTGKDALLDNGAFFGFISPTEEPTGQFHDLSFVIFPTDTDKAWLVCIGIGSLGFKNDYELASRPGIRRLLSRIIKSESGYCKLDFSDIETNLPKKILNNDSLTHLKNTMAQYAKVLPACQIIKDPISDNGKKQIIGFLAAYAKIRNWASNNSQRSAITKALNAISKDSINIEDEEEELVNLISKRKYVILQGPPGTGKTRMAKIIAQNLSKNIYFTQFHAETTYSDFIYGIRPNIDSSTLVYSSHKGIFVEALEQALNNSENVFLIIDEINRANLANVLGPIFYLFEFGMEKSQIEIELYPGLRITELPENLYVIGTMNTADRSIAVVDIALRRRFAWYSIKPQPIKSKNFWREDFEQISEIFNLFASSNELPLQPGQGYFLASTEEEMKSRIRFELLPLIKEYITEGILTSAKEEFNEYFVDRIGKSLFE